ncbi:MAG: PD40 domain-containing protein [Acidobacteria bacterium]|nr:PD40 domain-containing protein [Acidobacteriota bacterium]
MQEGSCEWSSEGRYILYVTGTRLVGSGTDLRVLPLFGDRKPFHYLAAPGNQLYAQFSPDGGWVAYSSDESGPLRLMWRRSPGRVRSGSCRTMVAFRRDRGGMERKSTF